jgi:hypothetical protein
MADIKHGFTSMKAFTGLGYSLKNVIKGDTSVLTLPPSPISNPKAIHPDGSWILSGKTVFYVSKDGYIPAPSWGIFLNNGGGNKFLVKANTADIKDRRPILPTLVLDDERVMH